MKNIDNSKIGDDKNSNIFWDYQEMLWCCSSEILDAYEKGILNYILRRFPTVRSDGKLWQFTVDDIITQTGFSRATVVRRISRLVKDGILLDIGNQKSKNTIHFYKRYSFKPTALKELLNTPVYPVDTVKGEPVYPVDTVKGEPVYPVDTVKGEPVYPIDQPVYPIDQPVYPIDQPVYPIDQPVYPIDTLNDIGNTIEDNIEDDIEKNIIKNKEVLSNDVLINGETKSEVKLTSTEELVEWFNKPSVQINNTGDVVSVPVHSTVPVDSTLINKSHSNINNTTAVEPSVIKPDWLTDSMLSRIAAAEATLKGMNLKPARMIGSKR